jgi:hypothetical protein
MFRLLGVILRPSIEPNQDYLIAIIVIRNTSGCSELNLKVDINDHFQDKASDGKARNFKVGFKEV